MKREKEKITVKRTKRNDNLLSKIVVSYGGQGGIRTHEPLARLPDFESCSHLALSCLLWSVTAALETAKTLVLQRFSDMPAGIDQLHIRKNQSSNSNEKRSKTTSFLHAGKKIRKKKTLVRYGSEDSSPD